MEGLFAKPEKADGEIIRAGTAPSPGAALRAALTGTGLLDALPPAARRGLSRLAARMDAFQNTRIPLLGPDFDLN
ncbi:MAG: hypothetical protein K9N23_14070 [Akkermansiaceae bacterium]|nr:hypothetical protein [Akkermansiaceae bacterium]MCF7732811.1 hypothetical protein [Akkermansiaceae bacterium]